MMVIDMFDVQWRFISANTALFSLFFVCQISRSGLIVATQAIISFPQVNITTTTVNDVKYDIEILRNRIVKSFEPTTPAAAADMLNSTLNWTTTMLPNGTWSDVDYHPVPVASLRNTWPPLEHVTRLASMATCYATRNITQCYRQQKVYDTVVRVSNALPLHLCQCTLWTLLELTHYYQLVFGMTLMQYCFWSHTLSGA